MAIIDEDRNVIEATNIGVKFKLRKKSRRRLRDWVLMPISGGQQETEFWALRGVSFTVRRGEVWALVGRNGAGKSTLLRVIAGIYRPDEGHITVNGRVSPLLALGAGFQADLTGRDNIYLSGVLLGLKREEIDAKIGDIIEFSGLSYFIDSKVRSYSTGMVARLGFSIATVIEPDILLIDEVMSVGDKEFREKARRRMEELMESARVIVMATHNLEVAKEMCDYAIWLEKGHVKKIGLAREVIEAYEKYG